MAVFIATKLFGKQNSENYTAFYGSDKLVFHFGTPTVAAKIVCEIKRDLPNKVTRCTSGCFGYHF